MIVCQVCILRCKLEEIKTQKMAYTVGIRTEDYNDANYGETVISF